MSGKKLLIVEDDPKSLHALRSVLEARNYQVVACGTAESALGLNEDHYDAAILDVRLPKMQGLELARQLQEMHPGMRIIFVTAYDGPQDREAVLPGSRLIVKPIDVDALLRML